MMQVQAGASTDVLAGSLAFNHTTISNWWQPFGRPVIRLSRRTRPRVGHSQVQGHPPARMYRLLVGKDPRQLQSPPALLTGPMAR